MDTTLRDGEQTSNVSFDAVEKLSIAKILLKEVKVDRIEVSSARVSDGEAITAKKIIDWARGENFLDRIEILSFLDNFQSLNWVKKVGGRVINILSKGSLNHLKNQLKQTPEQHLKSIKETILKGESFDISCNIYLEDWSNGFQKDREYIYFLIENLKDLPLKRFMLPDTLGILNSFQVYEFCSQIKRKYPDVHFDFHGHNDYDMATSNCLAAVKAGFNGIHTTVNGLGERAGNSSLASCVVAINDHYKKKQIAVNEKKLNKISKLIEAYSSQPIAANQPIIGDNVFTQTCGVHADGDNKAKLYYNDLLPSRFLREREYALGKTSGKANIKENLLSLGIVLSEQQIKEVTQRVVELADKKKTITKEDLPYIVSDIIGDQGDTKTEQKIKLLHYSFDVSDGLDALANIKIQINNKVYQKTSVGNGQYNAFASALKNIYKIEKKKFPILMNYKVNIPPGGRTDALVETIIHWQYKKKNYKTVGVDSDQLLSAISATIKVLNIIEKE